VRIQSARRRRDGSGQDVVEASRQIVLDPGARARQVVALAGVGTQVVELGARRPDVLPPLGAHRVQRTPAAEELGVLRLEIRGTLRRRVEQRLPLVRVVGSQAVEVQERRRHVREAARPRLEAGRDARTGENERHALRRVVHEDRVRDLAVGPERLTMIGGEENRRAPVGSMRKLLSFVLPTMTLERGTVLTPYGVSTTMASW